MKYILPILIVTVFVTPVKANPDITGSFCTPSIPTCTTIVEKDKSIQSAINNSKSGDVICVAPGQYKQKVDLNKEGVWLVSKTTEKPIIDGSTLNLGRYERLVTVSAANTKLINFKIQKSAGRCLGLYAQKPKSLENVLVDSVYVTDCGQEHLHVIGENDASENGGSSKGLTIQNSVFEYAYGSCLKGMNDATIKNNIFRYGNTTYKTFGGEALMVDCNYGRSTNNKFYNNFVYNNLKAAVYVHATTGADFTNNVIFQTEAGPVPERQTWAGFSVRGQEVRSYDNLGGKPYNLQNNKFENNIVWGNVRNGISIAGGAPDTTYTNTTIKNNTFYIYSPDTEASLRIDSQLSDIHGSSGPTVGYTKYNNFKIESNLFYNAANQKAVSLYPNSIPNGVTFKNNTWNKKPSGYGSSFSTDVELTPNFVDAPNIKANPQTYNELIEMVKGFKATNTNKGANIDEMVKSMQTCATSNVSPTPTQSEPTPPTPSPTVKYDSFYDLNSDNKVDLQDVIAIIKYIFSY
jgi:hypothetical protein